MTLYVVKATAGASLVAGGTLTFPYPSNPISGNTTYPYPFDPLHQNANPPPVQVIEQFAAGDFLSSPTARAYSAGNQAVLLEGIHFTLAYNTPVASGITMTLVGAGAIAINSLVSLQVQTAGQGDGAVFKTDSRISRGVLAPAAILRMGSPLAGTATAVLAAIALTVTTLNTLATAVVLDVPRTLVYVSTNAGDTTQTLTTRGFDEFNQPMTEIVTLNGTTIVAGKKAFKQVNSYQASAALAGNLTIGTGNILGFPVPIEVLGYIVQDITDGVKSATQGTYVAATDNVVQTGTTGDVRGTFAPNTVPNGVHAYEVLMVLPDPTYTALPQFAG